MAKYRRWRKTQPANIFQPLRQGAITAFCLIALSLLAEASHGANNGESVGKNNSVEKSAISSRAEYLQQVDDPAFARWYMGGAWNFSSIDPKRNDLRPRRSDYRLDDRAGSGARLTLGWVFNSYFSLEAFVSDLGRAEFSPNGKVNHRVVGISSVWQTLLYRHRTEQYAAGNVAGFLKAGVGRTIFDGYDVRYQGDRSIQLNTALGVEYYLPDKFSLRMELESYDSQLFNSRLSAFSLGVTKRF